MLGIEQHGNRDLTHKDKALDRSLLPSSHRTNDGADGIGSHGRTHDHSFSDQPLLPDRSGIGLEFSRNLRITQTVDKYGKTALGRVAGQGNTGNGKQSNAT